MAMKSNRGLYSNHTDNPSVSRCWCIQSIHWHFTPRKFYPTTFFFESFLIFGVSRYGTLASGGSDGMVNLWDGVHQHRIRQFPKYPEEISSVAFNCNGSELAVACSYTFDEGERPKASDTIAVRYLSDTDCKPSL